MQRLRVRFARGDEIKFISHLDIMRLWERALTRAGIRTAYSEGFSPHPRLSLAAPLAVGVTGESELLDVYTVDTVSPHWFTDAVNKQLPVGISILGVQQVGMTLPSLQSQVRQAEYRIEVGIKSGAVFHFPTLKWKGRMVRKISGLPLYRCCHWKSCHGPTKEILVNASTT